MIKAKRVLSQDWDNSAGYIYVNGCSHTAGTWLALPNMYDSYAFGLGELLGLNTVSSASASSSNQRIYRSTIDFFSDAKVMPEIAVIQWTGVDRFETPNNLEALQSSFHMSTKFNYVDDHHEGWYQHLPASVFDKRRTKLNIPFRKFYREAIYPDYFQNGKDISNTRDKLEAANAAQILGLDAYLKSLGVRVIHLIWEGFSRNEINSTLQAMLDTVEIPMDDPYEALASVIHTHGYQVCKEVSERNQLPDNHYMADAHHQIATWLYAYIQYGTKIELSKEYIDERDPIGKLGSLRSLDTEDRITHYDLGK